MTDSKSSNKLLSIYLNDHLAGSMIGVGLARRASASNSGTPLGEHLEALAAEIESDREALESVMAESGVRRNSLKAAGARVAEKLRRVVKLNGRLTGYSPLSRFLELESLYLGITGKRELWRALQRSYMRDVPGVDFEELERRAERQAADIEDHRLEAARLAFGGTQHDPPDATQPIPGSSSAFPENG